MNHWFGRTFDHGTKQRSLATVGADDDRLPLGGASPPAPAAANDRDLEEARLAARAEVWTAAARIARVFEEKGASAGTVRLRLSHLEDEAWSRLEAHHHFPLAGAGDIAEPASASGDEGRLESVRRTVDLIRAQVIRLVDSGTPITPRHAAGLADLLETVSALCRGERLIRPTPEPTSLRAVDPPTLRVV